MRRPTRSSPDGGADPDDLGALRALTESYRAQNRTAEAVLSAERFMAAVLKSPSWLKPDAYRLSGRMWIELGHPELAVASLARSEQLDYQSIATGRLFSLVPGIRTQLGVQAGLTPICSPPACMSSWETLRGSPGKPWTPA